MVRTGLALFALFVIPMHAFRQCAWVDQVICNITNEQAIRTVQNTKRSEDENSPHSHIISYS